MEDSGIHYQKGVKILNTGLSLELIGDKIQLEEITSNRYFLSPEIIV